jgi:hypothetical protein
MECDESIALTIVNSFGVCIWEVDTETVPYAGMTSATSIIEAILYKVEMMISIVHELIQFV